jgi:hypothetical protein
MFGHQTDKNTKFSEISQAEDDCETLLSDSESRESHRKVPRRILSSWSIALFLIASLCLSAFFGAWIGSRWPLLRDSDAFCTRHVSQYCKQQSGFDGSISVEAETMNF